MKPIRLNNKGFTLIEMMIALTITGVVVGAVYAVNQAYVKAWGLQKQAVDVQQNIRAAMFYLSRDFQMAGFDPNEKAESGIEAADANTMTLSIGRQDGLLQSIIDGLDVNSDVVSYTLSGDGQLIRSVFERDDGGNEVAGTSHQAAVGFNIEALDFVYLDSDGNVTADVSDITAIQVTLVARGGSDQSATFADYKDNRVYRNQQGTVILDKSGSNADAYPRRMFSSEFFCRNI